MACSEARLAANRVNALKSTGPRTEAGKEASRRNSLKHGLTGAGVVVPGEDAEEIAPQSAAFLAELAPDDRPTAQLLAGRVATLAVRLKRSERHEFAATAGRCRVAAIEFDEARVAEAGRLFAAIDEGTNRDELLAMPEGLDLLDSTLAELRAVAAAGDPARWSSEDSARLARCLPGDLRARAEAPSLAPDQVVGLIDAGHAHLDSLRPGLDLEGVARAREEAVDLVLVDDSPETLRARRYEAATERAIHQALREIRHWRRPAPEASSTPTATPTPTMPPDPEEYRMPADLVREAEEMRRLLSGLAPIGVAAHIPPLGSIFPGTLDVSAAGLGSTVADAEAAPRGRSRFEDKRKRPKLGH